MKSIFAFAIALFLSNFESNAQAVSINPTGAAPHSSAMLDVSSAAKGVLIPRVSLTSTEDLTTVPSPAISLLVYNTSTAGTPPNNIIPGFYYWQSSKWNPMVRPPGLSAFAQFFALMPPNNFTPVLPGNAIEFPNNGVNSGDGIILLDPTTFMLTDPGTYMVNWIVSVDQTGQLAISLNGSILPHTVFGRATGSSQIIGNGIIIAPVAFSILQIVNPPNNNINLTLTPLAGGNTAVSASLIITRLQ